MSVTSVTSGRIFSAAEAKTTSLIGITIFKNGIQFRIGEEKTIRVMISADRNVSRDYNLPGRKTIRGPFIDKFFKNHIKNQCEKLLNGAYIYGIHFQYNGKKTKDTPLLNILDGGDHLPVSFQNILDFKGHTTGGQKKDSKFVADSFFDPKNDLDPEKKLVDLHMFDGASVYIKAQKYRRLSILFYHVLLEHIRPDIMCLKGGHILRK